MRHDDFDYEGTGQISARGGMILLFVPGDFLRGSGFGSFHGLRFPPSIWVCVRFPFHSLLHLLNLQKRMISMWGDSSRCMMHRLGVEHSISANADCRAVASGRWRRTADSGPIHLGVGWRRHLAVYTITRHRED